MSNRVSKSAAVALVTMATGGCADQPTEGLARTHHYRSCIPGAQACASTPSQAWLAGGGDGNANDVVGEQPRRLGNGATFVRGLVGQGFSFDGIDDHDSVPDSPTLTPPSNSMTLDAWINPNTVSGPRIIVTKYSPGLDVSWDLDGARWRAHPIRRVPEPAAADHRSRFRHGQPGRDALGVWQHVAATFDVTTQDVGIYVNGVEVPTTPQA